MQLLIWNKYLLPTTVCVCVFVFLWGGVHSWHAPLSHKACVSRECWSPRITFMALTGALTSSAPDPENKYVDVLPRIESDAHESLVNMWVMLQRLVPCFTFRSIEHDSAELALRSAVNNCTINVFYLLECVYMNTTLSRCTLCHSFQIWHQRSINSKQKTPLTLQIPSVAPWWCHSAPACESCVETSWERSPEWVIKTRFLA